MPFKNKTCLASMSLTTTSDSTKPGLSNLPRGRILMFRQQGSLSEMRNKINVLRVIMG